MTQPKLDRRSLVTAICATATWAMVGIFVRWLPGWSPFAILTGRFFVATVVLLPLLLLAPSVRNDLVRSLRTAPIWWLSLPAIGSYLLGTTSYQMAPIGEVTLLFTTSPLFIIAYKYISRLPVKQSEGWGMLLAMVGVSSIVLPQLATDRAISWQTIVGYLLALGAAGLLALYTFLFNTFTDREIVPKPISIVFVTFLLGGLLSLPCAIFFSNLSIVTRLDRQEIFVLLGLGILATALPLLLYTIAARRLSILLITAILLLEPIFAVLFAAISLQEIPSLWFGIGSILVCCGLLSIAK
jgi:drug/metabolite transporter (DMT)-like permease